MDNVASDQRIESIVAIPSPASLSQQLPLEPAQAQSVVSYRQSISDIIHGKDRRQLVIVGPCSIHDPKAAIEYAQRLKGLRTQYSTSLEIVMRVYFEKPRTIVGWKGFINDPNMDGSYEIAKGLYNARQLLLEITAMGMPVACEFLDAATGQFYADTVSWGAIGARTTESQVHRELASGLSCPVGFKNGTNGNIDIAIDAMQAASHPHAFISPDPTGQIALYRTSGNSDAHLILRGGTRPNYHTQDVAAAMAKQNNAGLSQRLLIDCSHANSAKDFKRQAMVLNDVATRLGDEIHHIGGVMLESHLVDGNQKLDTNKSLTYGQSITDACIGWEETETLLAMYAKATANALGQQD